MLTRGKVHSPQRASQLRDFSGLRYGKITPTDIDCFLDFGNRLFVVIEAKLVGANLPTGQCLALERLVDASHTDRRKAIGFVCEHKNPSGEIDFSSCVLVAYRWRGVWRKPRYLITVRNATDRLLTAFGLEYYLNLEVK